VTAVLLLFSGDAGMRICRLRLHADRVRGSAIIFSPMIFAFIGGSICIGKDPSGSLTGIMIAWSICVLWYNPVRWDLTLDDAVVSGPSKSFFGRVQRVDIRLEELDPTTLPTSSQICRSWIVAASIDGVDRHASIQLSLLYHDRVNLIEFVQQVRNCLNAREAGDNAPSAEKKNTVMGKFVSIATRK